MELSIDFTTITGKVKPMHAVNNGPRPYGRKSQINENFISYKEAGIPYARNHDASFYAGYGGEHSVDVANIFRDFDADPEDPANYDFYLTDQYIISTLAAGTETFYRLGSKIEHASKKYNTLPPKDFHKWAVICGHIIEHMNGDFADGKHFGIRYWEIWNEPDLDPDDAADKRTWGGTEKEFFELYAITSRYLKEKFPDLMIGGPALAGNKEWAARFIAFCEKEKLPLDFFSWHCYAHDMEKPMDRVRYYRDLLDTHGYKKSESILNEWNYVKDWQGDKWVYSIKQIIGIKGAAFIADMMLSCQNSGALDMLMYYDARPGSMNSLWDYYTCAQLKGYYPFYFFNKLYRLGNTVKVECEEGPVHASAATDGEHGALMLSYFTDDDAETRTVPVHITEKGVNGTPRAFVVDRDLDGTEVPFDGTVTLRPQSVALITW